MYTQIRFLFNGNHYMKEKWFVFFFFEKHFNLNSESVLLARQEENLQQERIKVKQKCLRKVNRGRKQKRIYSFFLHIYLIKKSLDYCIWCVSNFPFQLRLINWERLKCCWMFFSIEIDIHLLIDDVISIFFLWYISHICFLSLVSSSDLARSEDRWSSHRHYSINGCVCLCVSVCMRMRKWYYGKIEVNTLTWCDEDVSYNNFSSSSFSF